MSLFALPKVVQQQLVGEIGTYISTVKFLQDIIQQKVLISADFSQ